MKLGFESFFYISRISKTKLIVENQQTWREENSDLKESLETMKKKYGTYGRNVG
jgi:threonyl-tRNA synthetase